MPTSLHNLHGGRHTVPYNCIRLFYTQCTGTFRCWGAANRLSEGKLVDEFSESGKIMPLRQKILGKINKNTKKRRVVQILRAKMST